MSVNHYSDYSEKVYNDYNLSFDKLLEKEGPFTAHRCNIQTLAIGLLKPTTIYLKLRLVENAYSFRRNREQQIPKVNTVWNGSKSVRYLDQLFGK